VRWVGSALNARGDGRFNLALRKATAPLTPGLTHCCVVGTRQGERGERLPSPPAPLPQGEGRTARTHRLAFVKLSPYGKAPPSLKLWRASLCHAGRKGAGRSPERLQRHNRSLGTAPPKGYGNGRLGLAFDKLSPYGKAPPSLKLWRASLCHAGRKGAGRSPERLQRHGPSERLRHPSPL